MKKFIIAIVIITLPIIYWLLLIHALNYDTWMTTHDFTEGSYPLRSYYYLVAVLRTIFVTIGWFYIWPIIAIVNKK